MWGLLGIKKWKCGQFSVKTVKAIDENQHPTPNPPQLLRLGLWYHQVTIPLKGLKNIYYDSGLIL